MSQRRASAAVDDPPAVAGETELPGFDPSMTTGPTTAAGNLPGDPSPDPASGLDSGPQLSDDAPLGHPAAKARGMSSSPASTDDAAAVLAKVLAIAVRKIARALHNRRTPDVVVVGEGVPPVDARNTVWLATIDEAEAIGAPLGRIAAKRLPARIVALLAGGGGTIGDASSAFDAVDTYARKNVEAEIEWRAHVEQLVDARLREVGMHPEQNQPPAA